MVNSSSSQRSDHKGGTRIPQTDRDAVTRRDGRFLTRFHRTFSERFPGNRKSRLY